jgi:sulfatase maturation enzyme AslB (radical SAM superfamily)
MEKMNFEKEGLKIDKERVLTYSELSCPLDCKYCFVDDLSSSNQKVGVPYLRGPQTQFLI